MPEGSACPIANVSVLLHLLTSLSEAQQYGTPDLDILNSAGMNPQRICYTRMENLVQLPTQATIYTVSTSVVVDLMQQTLTTYHLPHGNLSAFLLFCFRM